MSLLLIGDNNDTKLFILVLKLLKIQFDYVFEHK